MGGRQKTTLFMGVGGPTERVKKTESTQTEEKASKGKKAEKKSK
ncbi:hypothetical protein [Fervidicoccus fontis]|uniref:Uncharacterized protein n=1 Tax=Fervidicoccus fontis (strain DSM 19380 / JCM 18336 / VKM B-2539 / Kam940) TaxID=1163730 RepID=I0A0K8_FERFK|nr:hypothetical protein [Fervidicoccus fontis]AFH42515.1 hypothetical protein FFONT_0525 [Fervidicoccus fontis Kam940]